MQFKHEFPMLTWHNTANTYQFVDAPAKVPCEAATMFLRVSGKAICRTNTCSVSSKYVDTVTVPSGMGPQQRNGTHQACTMQHQHHFICTAHAAECMFTLMLYSTPGQRAVLGTLVLGVDSESVVVLHRAHAQVAEVSPAVGRDA